jgi:hypothetical protein
MLSLKFPKPFQSITYESSYTSTLYNRHIVVAYFSPTNIRPLLVLEIQTCSPSSTGKTLRFYEFQKKINIRTICTTLVSYFAYFSAMKIKATYYCKWWVYFQRTMRPNNSKCRTLNNHSRQNFIPSEGALLTFFGIDRYVGNRNLQYYVLSVLRWSHACRKFKHTCKGHFSVSLQT